MCSGTFDLGKPAVRELGERWPISNDLKRWRECSKHRELCVDRSRSPHPMCQFSSFHRAWPGWGSGFRSLVSVWWSLPWSHSTPGMIRVC